MYKNNVYFYVSPMNNWKWNFLKMPLTIAPQSVIILYKSNKNVHNLFVENYRTLMKEVKDYLNTWRGHIHRLESIFTEANVAPNWSIG